MDETVLPTAPETVPATEPAAVVPEETHDQNADGTMTQPTDPTEAPGSQSEDTIPEEGIPAETLYEDMIPEATEVTAVDYTPVIENSTMILANVILCAALIIVGFLAAVKFWGAK